MEDFFLQGKSYRKKVTVLRDKDLLLFCLWISNFLNTINQIFFSFHNMHFEHLHQYRWLKMCAFISRFSILFREFCVCLWQYLDFDYYTLYDILKGGCVILSPFTFCSRLIWILRVYIYFHWNCKIVLCYSERACRLRWAVWTL